MIIDAGLKRFIQLALKEDIGPKDITSYSVIPRKKNGKFVIVAKQDCIVCGLNLAEAVFEIIDANISFKPVVNDGMAVSGGKAIAYIEGNDCSILSAERTALNFLCWLSGISTLTSRYVEKIKGTRATIYDTRKTIPTFRKLQKYAVKIGGGTNHRMGLYDQVLIKDNHIASLMASPTITPDRIKALEAALKNARANAPKNMKIEVEVDSIVMFKAALACNPDIIMLDNMGLAEIKQAVQLRDSYRIKTQDVGFKTSIEVSGGVNMDNVRAIAECGVDMISIGSLTHSSASIDMSLEPC